MRSWRRALGVFGVVAGIVLGTALSYVPDTEASRNSSGTYSLPAGNPVVTGTTITSSWANTTLSDLGTEITSSLDRSGRGAMLSNLNLVNGSAAAPAVRFDSDTDTGMYRVGAGNLGFSVDATKVYDATSTATTITGTCTVTGQTFHANGTSGAPSVSFTNDTDSGLYRGGAGDIRMSVDNGDRVTWTAARTTISTGLTITEDTSNGDAIASTGNGTGVGVRGTGGSSSGAGVVGQGGGSGADAHGIVGNGGGTSGRGGSFAGAGSGAGAAATGGATGIGVAGTGGGTAAGGSFANGTAATGGTEQAAIQATNGYVQFSGVTAPDSTNGITNMLAPTNLTKLWAVINCNSGSAPTVAAGFNVASVSLNADGKDIDVTVADDFASTSYLVVATSGASAASFTYSVISQATGSFRIEGFDSAGAGVEVDHDSFTRTNCVHVIALGAQ